VRVVTRRELLATEEIVDVVQYDGGDQAELVGDKSELVVDTEQTLEAQDSDSDVEMYVSRTRRRVKTSTPSVGVRDTPPPHMDVTGIPPMEFEDSMETSTGEEQESTESAAFAEGADEEEDEPGADEAEAEEPRPVEEVAGVVVDEPGAVEDAADPTQRRTTRATAGKHSNPNRLPKSVLQQGVEAVVEDAPSFEDFGKAIASLGASLGQVLQTSWTQARAKGGNPK
jgi:hypothetical protein